MEARAVEAEASISSSPTKDDALANAISAAEFYMKAIKLATTQSERGRLKQRCMSALARAEEIKKIKQWPPSVGNANLTVLSPQPLKAPYSSRGLSTREEVILLEGSKLHGLLFPPWNIEPSDAEFKDFDGHFYTDLSEIPVSQAHTRDFAGWKRPTELLNGTFTADSEDIHAISEPTMQASADIDLVQDVTADCSVVASLCAMVARPGGTFGRLLESIFYPYDKLLRLPRISENGKYIFRLHFNGCFRKVVVDDRLPASKGSRTLHVFDRRNPGLLWPALLEKAYLKVRGGYDFPGSNSGTDLGVLTGWIPEQIFLQSDELQENNVWHRILKSFAFGDVMVTLGTGCLNPHEEEAFGLAGEHDYAVLDIKEVGQRQLLLVKNPWCDGMVWKGMAHESITKHSMHEKTGTEEVGNVIPSISAVSSGTFWISYQDVVRNFNSLYLNWNPGLFRHRQDHHFIWNIPHSTSAGCFTQNPQYSVRSTCGGTVWILLSRHFNTEEHSNYSAKSTDSGSATMNPLGFISLYTFDAEGQRIHLSDSALLRGPFVDSPQTLAKLEMPVQSCYTLVVAQQDLPLSRYSFTLSAYSNEPIVINEAASRYPHHTTLNGAWTLRTSGGNANAATYPSNPQFKISVGSMTDLSILLEATPQELAVHVKMVWAGGARVTSVTSQSILGESGDYRRGCALANLPNVPAGDYTIVCSTFESGQTGKFTLRVESMIPCKVTPVPSEDAGRLRIPLPILVLREGIDRMLAPVVVSRFTRFRVVAQHCDSRIRNKTRSSLRISLERGQGPNKKVLATSNSGGFSDALAGVRIEDIDVDQEFHGLGGLWLVVDRFGSNNAFDEVRVQILSEAPLNVGPWGAGDG